MVVLCEFSSEMSQTKVIEPQIFNECIKCKESFEIVLGKIHKIEKLIL